jgi:hypothetical protein
MVGNRLWAAILVSAGSLIAQQDASTVPFVGCKSDGQVGPLEAPTGKSTHLVTSQSAQQLAFYKAQGEFGVLAPRDWYCFGVYGSGGDTLYVSSIPIDTANLFSGGLNVEGPAIALVHRFGNTSGRFSVAELVAHVFPAYSQFAKNLTQEYPLMVPFTFSPYPKDKLTYKTKAVVEFHTPAQADGLGTYLALTKSDAAIDGVAIIIEPEFDSLVLSVRLPLDLSSLKSAIVSQIERDSRTSKAK